MKPRKNISTESGASKFLFVQVEGGDHKAQPESRLEVRQHVMANKSRRQKRSGVPKKDRTASSSLSPEDELPAANQSRFQDTAEGKLSTAAVTNPATTSPLPADNDTKDIDVAYWWLRRHITPAPVHLRFVDWDALYWRQKPWEDAQECKPLMDALTYLSYYIRASLTGQLDDTRVHLVKARLLRLVASVVQNPSMSLDGPTVGAILTLAKIDIENADYASGRIHMQAIQTAVNIESLIPRYWMYLTVTDLRLAALTFNSPHISYHVPKECQSSFSMDPELKLAAQRAAEANTEMLPSSNLTPASTMLEIFHRLHLITSASTHHNGDLIPSFGQIYDVEYKLCRILDTLEHSTQKINSVLAAELCVLASQATFWHLAPIFMPADPDSSRMQHSLTDRMHEILQLIPDLHDIWLDNGGSLQILLWALFLGTGYSTDGEPRKDHRLFVALGHTAQKLQLRTLRAFRHNLTAFPWIEHWSEAHCSTVWEQLKTKGFVEESQTVPIAELGSFHF